MSTVPGVRSSKTKRLPLSDSSRQADASMALAALVRMQRSACAITARTTTCPGSAVRSRGITLAPVTDSRAFLDRAAPRTGSHISPRSRDPIASTPISRFKYPHPGWGCDRGVSSMGSVFDGPHRPEEPRGVEEPGRPGRTGGALPVPPAGEAHERIVELGPVQEKVPLSG